MFNKICWLILLVVTSSSCAFHDTGQTDYRINMDNDKHCIVSKCLKDLTHQTVYHNDNHAIKKGDTVAIRLKRAFIKNFKEHGLNIDNQLLRANGEITIVSRVGTDIDLTSINNIPQDARIVFYSSDVQEGQFLNFHNMPIYGPITYDGSPLQMEITMLEIDSDTAQVQSILSNLAQFGGKAYPPADPILKILENLSNTILNTQNGNNDSDLALQVTGGFDSPESYAQNPNYARFVAGDYVYIRTQNRQISPDWENLSLDKDTGILYCKQDKSPHCQAGKEYKENTYMVVQILKNLPANAIDQAQGFYTNSTGFAKLMTQINTNDKQASQEIDKSMKKALTRQAITYNFDKMRQLTNTLKSSVQKLVSEQCELSDIHSAKVSATSLVHFLTQSHALDEANKDKNYNQFALDSEQRSYLSNEIVNAFSGYKNGGNLINFAGKDIGTSDGATIEDITNEIEKIKQCQ